MHTKERFIKRKVARPYVVQRWTRLEDGTRISAGHLTVNVETPLEAVEVAARMWSLEKWQWNGSVPQVCLRVARSLAEAR